MKKIETMLTVAVLATAVAPAHSAQVIATDLIVKQSECIGLDCVSNESFGFDTLRLKENNLRIHFDDTSITGSFPDNDWRIVVNDTNNGGASRFSIEDATAGRAPFTIAAGAAVNALYIDRDGDVGVGTANPILPLHVVRGNTPGLRLEQDGSAGFARYTWDQGRRTGQFSIYRRRRQSGGGGRTERCHALNGSVRERRR